MTPQRFQQVRNLFEAAVDRSTADRAAFVAEACGQDLALQQEVIRLLGAHDATLTMREAGSGSLETFRTDSAAREGRRLGDYQILRQLGRGGMGSVYLARRADEAFQKNVAIKILRADAANADILSRFHREREILAQLDHPNIARLLDAGETEDGLPYFVMEYVEGRSITEYADDQRLPIAERIGLFQQMCEAVEYAHQRKVVHRDLKPGNVLVTAGGCVKLLDFGIARLMEPSAAATALTQSGVWLMTPEYASPEQVRGEVAGRASDVYSLGVILFELLTGHRPYRLRSRIFHEVVRVVCEEPPTRPSAVIEQPVETTAADGKPATLPPETAGRLRQISLNDLKQQLRGDLDNILLKALDKQPQNRYLSVLQLRADIERHMSGESVWARSDSRLYQFGRLLSRYRMALVVAAVLVAAVTSGTVSLRWSALWWVAAGAALVGVWHAATDARTGRRVAESQVAKGGFIILLAAIGLGTSLLAALNPQGFAPVFLIINLALALVAIWGLAAWLLRSRWTGPLILDIGHSQEGRRIALLINFTTLPFNVVRILRHSVSRWRTHESLEPSQWAFLLWAIAIIALAWTSARQEIRRDGFMSRGRLIRWSRIASWNWENVGEAPGPITTPFSGPPTDPVLALHLFHPVKFLPPVRFSIGRRQKEEVEAILARQLGEWPAGN
jgi:serine/threonine protein kinase